MIDKERVALMTRLSIEEKRDSRQLFIMNDFWFNDYLTTELWKAFFALTGAFALLVLVWLVAFSDDWSYTYHIADVLALARRVFRGWALIEVFGLLLCLMAHVYYYIIAFRKRERCRKYLRQLQRSYEAEARREARERNR